MAKKSSQPITLEEAVRLVKADPNAPTVKEIQAHYPQILEAIERLRHPRVPSISQCWVVNPDGKGGRTIHQVPYGFGRGSVQILPKQEIAKAMLFSPLDCTNCPKASTCQHLAAYRAKPEPRG